MLRSARHTSLRSVGMVALLTALVGCGGAPSDKLKTVPGQGVVLLDGQPLTKGTVTFSPAKAATGGATSILRPAQAAIGPDGKFELSTVAPGDGLLPGDYYVGVVAVEGDGFIDPSHPNVIPKSLIPEKYNNPAKSGISITIPATGSTDLKVELKQK
jgi:hypothetical protein